MPQIASAKKRVKVAARQTEENRLHRARARTALKQVRDLMAAGKVPEALLHVSTAQAYLDKAAKSKALHPNAAARYKSRLIQALKAAGNKNALPRRTKEAAGKKTAKKPVKAAVKKAATKPAAKPTDKKSSG